MTDPDRYRTLFFSEARELVEGLNAPLLALERDPADQAALREAFRLVHTLKSLAAAVGFGRAADLAHAVESVLDRAQKGEAEISPPLVDLFFRAADQLGRLSTPDEGQVERDESDAMLEEMGHASQNHEAGAPAAPARPREAGEPESPRGGAAAAQTIRIRVQRLDSLINLAGELLIIKSRLRSIAAAAPADGLKDAVDQLERVSESLQREVLEARMRPIGFLFERFARTVRDLGHELGKEVSLVARGHDIELDRVILDDISEPLLHLLRNAVSHGIEPAEARRRLGKPAEGTITLEASREADRIVLEVRDDGGGIDPERLREAAVRLGFAGPERAQGLAPQELMALLFQPGFSTAREASDVSGRGVGLNVVKTRVEGLRGSVEASSAPGEGTCFMLRFPPTLAIVEALLVRAGRETFAVPMVDVAEVIQVDRAALLRSNVLLVRGTAVSVLDLGEVLGLGVGRPEQGAGYLLILAESRGGGTGFVVDQVLGRQEVVIKTVGSLLNRVAAFSGATIMGDGSVVLILDLPVLVRGALDRLAPAARAS